VLVFMHLFGRDSAFHALAVWSARLLVSLPIDMWILRRVTGLSALDQVRGAAVPTLASAVMGGAVLFAKSQLPLSLGPVLRLLPLGTLGLVVYVATVWLVDRQLVLQLSGFVRQTLRKRTQT
jgi:putative polysaccharide biosynthesis protein